MENVDLKASRIESIARNENNGTLTIRCTGENGEVSFQLSAEAVRHLMDGIFRLTLPRSGTPLTNEPIHMTSMRPFQLEKNGSGMLLTVGGFGYALPVVVPPEALSDLRGMLDGLDLYYAKPKGQG